MTHEEEHKKHFPTLWEILDTCIPDDHCRQVTSHYYLEKFILTNETKFFDHGCGSGNIKDWLKKKGFSVDYYGLDLPSSPEVSSRPSEHQECDCFYEYDGINCHFKVSILISSIPTIYSNMSAIQKMRYLKSTEYSSLAVDS